MSPGSLRSSRPDHRQLVVTERSDLDARSQTTPAGVCIRPARDDDLARIVEIYNASIPGRASTADLVPLSTEERRVWFDQHREERPIRVYEIDGAVAGWLSFEDFYGRAAYRHTAEISMYIAPESRGQGLGKQLLQDAMCLAPGIGLHTLVAYVFGHNRPSLRILHGAGFAEWGCLPRIAEMDGQEYDLLIMGKRIPKAGVSEGGG